MSFADPLFCIPFFPFNIVLEYIRDIDPVHGKKGGDGGRYSFVPL